jgi:pimeloyl-ACP methyl ester carboxylesterase
MPYARDGWRGRSGHVIDDMADIAWALPPRLVRFERIANCGHGPFFDAPDRTIDVIREFIAAEEAA